MKMPKLKDWEGCWNIDELVSSISSILEKMDEPGDYLEIEKRYDEPDGMDEPGDYLEIEKRYDEPDGGFHLTRNGRRVSPRSLRQKVSQDE